MLLRPPYTIGISHRLYLRWIIQKAPGQIPYRCYRRGCPEWPNIHPKGRRVSVTDTDACRLDVLRFHLLQILIVFLTPFLRYSCYQFMVKIKNCISVFGQKFYCKLIVLFCPKQRKSRMNTEKTVIMRLFTWRRRWDLNPCAGYPTYSLSRGAPSPLGYFSMVNIKEKCGGEEEIRTLGPLRDH